MDEPIPTSNGTESQFSEQEYSLKKIEDLKLNKKELTQSIESRLQKFFEDESNRINTINMYLSSRNFEEQQLKKLFPDHLITSKRMVTTIDLGEFRNPFLT